MPDTRHTSAVSVEERRVGTAHGSIFVREAPGDGPAVVLMHGFPNDSRIYNRLIPALAPLRVVAFDWSGYGRSDRRDSTQFSRADRQREMLAVLDELDLDHVVLVGHSYPSHMADGSENHSRAAHYRCGVREAGEPTRKGGR